MICIRLALALAFAALAGTAWAGGAAAQTPPGCTASSTPCADAGSATIGGALGAAGATALKGPVNTSIVVSIDASGATCDGTTDDSGKINTFLATFTKGHVVVIPAGKFCLIESANLVVPASVRIAGAGGPIQPLVAGALVGSGFLLNPAYTIKMGPGAQLDNLAVVRAGLKVRATPAQIISAVAQWGSEASVGVTIPPNVGGVLLSHLFIEGFNTAIFSRSGQFAVETLFADDYNGIETGQEIGDNFTISNVRLEPFYAMNVTPLTGAWARPGIGININGGAAELSKIFTIPWANGLVVNDHGDVQVTNSNFEWQTAWGNGIVGATGIRLIGTAGHVSVTDTILTTYDIPVSVESAGVVRFVNIAANTSSTTGPDFYLGGESGIPTTLTVGGRLVAGDAIAATFRSEAVRGSPLTVTYIIRPGDTAASAARGLAQAIDHVQALVSAHVAAISDGAVMTAYWPKALTVTVAAAVRPARGQPTITQSATRPRAGSFGSIIGADANGVATVPVFQTNVNTGYWNIVAPYFYKPLRPGWLSVASPDTGAITLVGIPWSNIRSSNLSSCGKGPRVDGGSNDGDGLITEGSDATGCKLTFTTPFYKAPVCALSSPSGAVATRYSTSATALTIVNTHSSADQFVYHCRPL